MRLRKIILGVVFSTANACSYAADAVLTADNDAINTSCSADATTAGCGSEKVGTGLLKCLHAYKKAHPDFKFSESCKITMKKRPVDKVSGK